MINIDDTKNDKNANYSLIAKDLSKEDIKELIKLLNEKDNEIRYSAFRILEARSSEYDDVYPYFDIFALKLINNNSYQRSIGAMMIAENAKWDNKKKIDNIINSYLSLCNDEKPITIRQCIQGLYKILPYKENLWDTVTDKLINMNLLEIKETMRKSIALDIIKALNYINDNKSNGSINKYFNDLCNGNLFDSKTIKELKIQIENGN